MSVGSRPVLSDTRSNEGRPLFSLDFRDEKGLDLLKIEQNSILFDPNGAWDFAFNISATHLTLWFAKQKPGIKLHSAGCPSPNSASLSKPTTKRRHVARTNCRHSPGPTPPPYPRLCRGEWRRRRRQRRVDRYCPRRLFARQGQLAQSRRTEFNLQAVVNGSVAMPSAATVDSPFEHKNDGSDRTGPEPRIEPTAGYPRAAVEPGSALHAKFAECPAAQNPLPPLPVPAIMGRWNPSRKNLAR